MHASFSVLVTLAKKKGNTYSVICPYMIWSQFRSVACRSLSHGPRGPVDHIALSHSPQKAWAPILCTVVENAASMFLFLFFENTTASLSVVIFAGCLGPVRDVPVQRCASYAYP